MARGPAGPWAAIPRLRAVLALAGAAALFCLYWSARFTFGGGRAAGETHAGGQHEAIQYDGEGEEPAGGEMRERQLWETPNGGPFNKSWTPCWSGRIPRSQNRTWGYVIVVCTGGAEHHQAQIGEAAAVAYQLNATLVVPRIKEAQSQADSDFFNLYALNHFVRSFQGMVRVVGKMSESHSHIEPVRVTVPKDVTAEHIERHVRPIFEKSQVILLGPFGPRLPENPNPENPLQAIRCLVTYTALRFGPELLRFGKRVVERMREAAEDSKGRFIAIDLVQSNNVKRADCTLREKDRKLPRNLTLAMQLLRNQRRYDKSCPLTPLEIGKFLRAMLYPRETAIYLTVARADSSVDALREMYPNLHTKEYTMPHLEEQQLPSKTVLAMLLDFHVCKESDVFIPAAPGLFRNALIGQRFYHGNRMNLRPSTLSMFNTRGLRWKQEAKLIRELHAYSRAAQLVEVGRNLTVGSNPQQLCMCRNSSLGSGSRTSSGGVLSGRKQRTGQLLKTFIAAFKKKGRKLEVS